MKINIHEMIGKITYTTESVRDTVELWKGVNNRVAAIKSGDIYGDAADKKSECMEISYYYITFESPVFKNQKGKTLQTLFMKQI